jgi:hypothetical protein
MARTLAVQAEVFLDAAIVSLSRLSQSLAGDERLRVIAVQVPRAGEKTLAAD